MFSNTEVIVTQIVLTQYIFASLSLSVISQRPILLTNLSKFMIWVSEAKTFSRYHQQGDFCVCSK